MDLFFISVMIKDKLTASGGNRLLQNDVMNTFCEIEVDLGDERDDGAGFPAELEVERYLGFRVYGLGFRVLGSGFRV